MAFTAESYDRAEWTFFYDPSFRNELRPLPYAELRLGDDGEERKYVVPLVGSSRAAFSPYRQRIEFRANRPFPFASVRHDVTAVHGFASAAL